MKGYSGKILHVDLPGKSTVEELDKDTVKEWIGGVGLGTKLLYDSLPSNNDPFSPDSPLIFTVGPFASTIVPTSGKYAVAARSPLTNMVGYGISSGSFGPTLKRAGYDALIFIGASSDPVYLNIRDSNVDLLSASDLWGKDVFETDDILRGRHGKGVGLCPLVRQVKILSDSLL